MEGKDRRVLRAADGICGGGLMMKVKDLKSQLNQHADERRLRVRGRVLEVLDERRRVVERIPIRVSTEERRWLGLQAEMRRRRLDVARRALG
jgi:hypothetical protein